MNIRDVTLTNFGSHAATTFTPAPLVLIVGENGAGKSTVASQAILFALFGEQAGSLDDFVRLGADVAQVELVFELRGNVYRVLRARSRKGRGQSRLELQVQAPNGFWQPLTGGTVAETQARLEDLLKLDFAAFVSSTCIVQGDPGFTARRPTERKAVLSSILRLDDLYAAIKERAQQGVRTWEARATLLGMKQEEAERAGNQLEVEAAALFQAEGAQTDVDARVKALEARLASLQEQIARLTADGQRAQELTARRAAIEKELVQLRGDQRKAAARRQELEAATLQRPQVEKAAAALQAARQRAAAYQGTRQEHDRRQAEERQLHDLVTQATAALERYRVESGSVLQRAETAATRLQKSDCPIIEQRPQCVFLKAAYADADQLETVRRDKAATEQRLQLQVDHAKNEHESCKNRIAKLGYRVDAHAAADAEVTRLASADRQLAIIEQAERLRGELVQREEQLAIAIEAKEADETAILTELVRLEDVAEDLADLRETRAAVSGALDQSRGQQRLGLEELARLKALVDQLRASADQLPRISAEREQAQREAYLYKELAKAFGPDGIPALVVDTVVAELSQVANNLLQRMPASGEVLQVEIRTLRDLKSVAGQKETLDIVVKVGEQELPFERLSGGQKVRVEFALRIGLGRLLAHRAGASVETLLIDEGAMGELDAAGRQAFIEAIRSVQTEFRTIIVVSHIAEIQDAGWPVVARVTKEHGVSRVEVA